MAICPSTTSITPLPRTSFESALTIVRAGFIVRAHYGEGVLLMNGKLVAHYNSVAASYGLQAGVQAFGYAMFLMTDKALEYLDKSDGWETRRSRARGTNT
jgi:lipid-binding SYLF domain-containing protein